MNTKLISGEKELKRLEAKRQALLRENFYCIECARFYQSDHVRTWFDETTITFQCLRGHVWEE